MVLKRNSSASFVIGRYTYGIQKENIHRVSDGANLIVGDFCSIAKNVNFILGGNHRADWISTYPFGHINQNTFGVEKFSGHPATNGDIIIGNDVWIGRGATIMSGVVVGDGAIIAANSHVVRDVSDYEIVGGNPAKRIKLRFSEDIIGLLKVLSWWRLPLTKIIELRCHLCAPPTRATLERILSEVNPAG
jgi:acetyltransferase-like isoleucine patch superfamily enzyme